MPKLTALEAELDTPQGTCIDEVRDVLLRVNGEEITDAEEMVRTIQGTEPGEAPAR